MRFYVDVIRKCNFAGHIYRFMMHACVNSCWVIIALNTETVHGLGSSGGYFLLK